MKKLSKIKNSFISRQVSTARISIKTVRSLLKNKDKNSMKDVLKGTFEGNIDLSWMSLI